MKSTTTDFAESWGYATFNNCPTVCIEVPDGNAITYSFRTSNGKRLTVCFLADKPGGPAACADIAYHDSGTSRKVRSGDVMPTFNLISWGKVEHDTRKQDEQPVFVTVLMDDKASA